LDKEAFAQRQKMISFAKEADILRGTRKCRVKKTIPLN
jgi:hypothetical protein